MNDKNQRLQISLAKKFFKQPDYKPEKHSSLICKKKKKRKKKKRKEKENQQKNKEIEVLMFYICALLEEA